MRKFLTLLAMIAISASVFAQKEVTKFMGIPVDGSPTEMIKKLKAKGFKTDEGFMRDVKRGLIDWDGPEVLTGRFNGERVRVYIVVETNKVWRIALKDKKDRDETQIKIRFNNLVRQFENNDKYVGTMQKVLVEGVSKNNEEMLTGRTDTNKVVVFEGSKDLIGDMVDVEIVSEHMWYLKGQIK